MRFTVKPKELAADDTVRDLAPFRIEAGDHDRARELVKVWAGGEVRTIRSISFGVGDVILVMVYPQKR
jgi:hypothetical protein